MNKARKELERARLDGSAHQELRYVAATSADGYTFDQNMVRRASVLWALQYDRRPEDLPLLRWLVQQEAICSREAPFQGLTEESKLAGFLLVEHRHVEDVWLHWELKRANFDTFCGYDLEYLLASGVSSTIEFVRSSTHTNRDAVLGHLLDGNGQPKITDADLDLDLWLTHMRSWFPTDPGEEAPITWVDRAQLVGDLNAARRYLDQWADGRERDPAMLSQLRYRLAVLGDFAEAAGAQRELLSFTTNAWDRASAWCSLAELERQAGDHQAAWNGLSECAQSLSDVPDWQEYGLGRSYVEELFQLSLAADDELAKTAFAAAHRVASTVPRLPFVVLEAAAKAAARIGDQRQTEHYRALRDAERRRIDTE
ncbi:MAG: hypothetical protein DLM55_07540 [Acidimicrobiales bacterium]|nr:MAG: hypothetical protein DLM55_07540 [Acidimicrobiales bacterium]